MTTGEKDGQTNNVFKYSEHIALRRSWRTQSGAKGVCGFLRILSGLPDIFYMKGKEDGGLDQRIGEGGAEERN